jgi:hypothetical protein
MAAISWIKETFVSWSKGMIIVLIVTLLLLGQAAYNYFVPPVAPSVMEVPGIRSFSMLSEEAEEEVETASGISIGVGFVEIGLPFAMPAVLWTSSFAVLSLLFMLMKTMKIALNPWVRISFLTAMVYLVWLVLGYFGKLSISGQLVDLALWDVALSLMFQGFTKNKVFEF